MGKNKDEGNIFSKEKNQEELHSATIKDDLSQKNEDEKALIKTNNLDQNEYLSNKKSVGFWLGIASIIVIVFQVICSYFNITFDVKILIELASFVFAILVVFGVLKSNSKSKNLAQIKEDIEGQLVEKVNDFKTGGSGEQQKNEVENKKESETKEN